MECSDFMQQLRSFKPQSLGCAVARRKSSTTLIFPLPPQACSGNDHKSFVQLLCCAFLFPMPFRYSKSMDWPFIMRPCRVRREKSVAFTPVIGQIMRFSVGCKKYHRLAHWNCLVLYLTVSWFVDIYNGTKWVMSLLSHRQTTTTIAREKITNSICISRECHWNVCRCLNAINLIDSVLSLCPCVFLFSVLSRWVLWRIST